MLGNSLIMAVALGTLFTTNVRMSDIAGKRAHEIWNNLKDNTSPGKYYFALAGAASLMNVRFKHTSLDADGMKLTRALVSMINWCMSMLLAHPDVALALWRKNYTFVSSCSWYKRRKASGHWSKHALH